jgi:hypothetical protein
MVEKVQCLFVDRLLSWDYFSVTKWGRGKVIIGFWFGGLKGRDHWEDLGVGGRITLRRTLGRYGSMGRTGFS